MDTGPEPKIEYKHIGYAIQMSKYYKSCDQGCVTKMLKALKLLMI